MAILKDMEGYGHELVLFGQDKETGMKAIIAVHDTTLGPAVGGTRFWNYATEEDAIYDVLRLSRGMSLKNAAAGLKLGGGKAVLIGDPKLLKSREFFHAYGRVVDSLGGKYYTAEDVNTNTQDIAYISEATAYVTGTPEISGNPSPFTARGVYQGMKAGVKTVFGTDDLKGLTVAVQGAGSVGYSLCEMLARDGAKLKVYDINPETVQHAVLELGAEALDAEAILRTECDVFAPCALGAVLNRENVGNLHCKLVCGAANNVLVDAEAGNALEAAGILYLPDFIVNAGGIINCGAEITDDQYDVDVINKRVDGIYDTTLKVLALAKEKGISTSDAGDLYAMNVIAAHRKEKAFPIPCL